MFFLSLPGLPSYKSTNVSWLRNCEDYPLFLFPESGEESLLDTFYKEQKGIIEQGPENFIGDREVVHIVNSFPIFVKDGQDTHKLQIYQNGSDARNVFNPVSTQVASPSHNIIYSDYGNTTDEPHVFYFYDIVGDWVYIITHSFYPNMPHYTADIFCYKIFLPAMRTLERQPASYYSRECYIPVGSSGAFQCYSIETMGPMFYGTKGYDEYRRSYWRTISFYFELFKDTMLSDDPHRLLAKFAGMHPWASSPIPLKYWNNNITMKDQPFRVIARPLDMNLANSRRLIGDSVSLLDYHVQKLEIDLSYQDTEKQYHLGRLSLANTQGVTSNDFGGLESVVELPKLLPTLKALGPLVRTCLKGKDPRAWADLYLCVKWGIKPLLNDAQAIKEQILIVEDSIQPKGWRTVRSSIDLEDTNTRGDVFRVKYCQKMIYNHWDSLPLKVARILTEYSLLPSFSQAWNLVPFSFVADWFLHVDSYLDRFDYYTNVHTLDVREVLISEKVEVVSSSIPLPKGTLDAGMRQYGKTYRRYRVSVPPYPIPRFEGITIPFKNAVDGAALIIQLSGKK